MLIFSVLCLQVGDTSEQRIVRRSRSFDIAYVDGELLRCGESRAVCLRFFMLDKNVCLLLLRFCLLKNPCDR